MSNNPDIITFPGGAQFLTAPDGTTAPDVAGDPVDLTGVPLTVAPSFAFQKGDNAAITAFAAGVLTVSGLLGNMTQEDVGRDLMLTMAQQGTAAIFNIAFPLVSFFDFSATFDESMVGKNIEIKGSTPGSNNGLYLITEVSGPATLTATRLGPVFADASVLSWRIVNDNALQGPNFGGNSGVFPIIAVLDPITVQVTNPNGLFPDAFSGGIVWNEVPSQTDFPPGDPLTYLAELATPFNINTVSPGPGTFADYDPTVPPNVTNDSSGLFSKVQRM